MWGVCGGSGLLLSLEINFAKLERSLLLSSWHDNWVYSHLPTRDSVWL